MFKKTRGIPIYDFIWLLNAVISAGKITVEGFVQKSHLPNGELSFTGN